MILRRLADAIRAQNWFTVLIEFVVVVAGIFVGLQVDDWNERRKERSLERDFIERLEAEVDANIAIYQTAIQQAESDENLYRDYFDYLNDPAAPSPDESQLLAGLCRVGVKPRPPYDNSVHDELVSAGRSDIIGYVQLRRSLMSYRTIQDRWAEGIAQLAPVNRKSFSDLEEYIYWRPVLPGGDYGHCLFDFETFKTNNKAASRIANAQRLQYFYLSAYQEILSGLMEVRTALRRGYPQIAATANEDIEETP